MIRIHVVTGDKDIESMIRGELMDALAPKEIDFALDVDEQQARRRISSRYDSAHPEIVVVQSEIPRHWKSPRIEHELRGVAVASELKAHYPELPVVILAHARTPEIEAIAYEHRSVEILIESLGWEEKLAIIIKKHLAGNAQKEYKYLKATFTLDTSNDCHGWELEGRSFGYRGSQGVLRINSQVWEDLTALSVAAGESKTYAVWHKLLQQTGKALGQEIINNIEFTSAFAHAVGIAGGFTKTKICFSVDRKSHPIALEALLSERLPKPIFPEGFWMLEAPIYRRIKSPPLDLEPFAQPRAVDRPNCLIIQCDLAQATTGLPPLKYAMEECSWLYKYLLERKEIDCLGEIEMLADSPSRSRSFKELLFAKLKERDWHMIHYAGHSIYRDECGFLIIPGAFPQDAPEEVSMVDIGVLLRKTRFLYLSSCESSSDSFFFELARNHVGSVLGFRWKVDDILGFEFAKKFYAAFFEREPRRRLEHAFLEARKQIKPQNEDKKIWAAPMMIVQSEQMAEVLGNA